MLFEIYKALEKPKSSNYGKFVQNAILCNILINISVLFILEYINLSENILFCLKIIEYVTVTFFCLELILRYISIGVDKEYRGIKGRLKFTLTPFIIIDIISLMPYLFIGLPFDSLAGRIIRFLRFFRILKLFRVQDSFKSLFNIGTFVNASIFIQFVVLLLSSITLITGFSIIFEKKLSIELFFSPSAIASIDFDISLLYGFVEIVLGLILGSTLISIITGLLDTISHNIRNGFHPFKGKNHIVIINKNSKLDFILEELNDYSKSVEKFTNVVVFLPLEDNIESFYQMLKKYSNLQVILIKGDPYNWGSYQKLNINFAQKVLILDSDKVESPFFHEKLVRFILSSPSFANPKLEFVVEAQSDVSEVVYKQIFLQNKHNFTIVKNLKVIQSFLSRSIINPNYFKVYSTLLSFEDSHIDIIDVEDLEIAKNTFENIYLGFVGGVVLGIIKEQQILLNPTKDTLVTPQDKLIVVIKSRLSCLVKNPPIIDKMQAVEINRPKLKLKRKICIIGDNKDFEVEQLHEFLHEESIANLQTFTRNTTDEYQALTFWDMIIEQNFDMIILNLEDDFEFILTMFLRNSYSHNLEFLGSIVNVIHDSVNLRLLIDRKLPNNIILSEKVVGEFMTQAMFNKNITHIFEEITHTQGNECYLLDRKLHAPLFTMTVEEVKKQLLYKNMLYIGVIKQDEFIIDAQTFAGAEQIVILAQGV